MCKTNSRKLICTLLALATLPFCADLAIAQSPSLWQRRDQRRSNLIADVKARNPGDLLSITINEQSDVDNRDLRSMRKAASSGMEASGSYGLGNGSQGSLTSEYESAADRAINGDTQYRSEREFLDQFTVMVVDTQPNGNLIVAGTRNVSLEGDARKLVLTGIVRRADVQPNNTVSSRLVYNLSLQYESVEGQGAEQKFINQGWLGKKLNKFWPF